MGSSIVASNIRARGPSGRTSSRSLPRADRSCRESRVDTVGRRLPHERLGLVSSGGGTRLHGGRDGRIRSARTEGSARAARNGRDLSDGGRVSYVSRIRAAGGRAVRGTVPVLDVVDGGRP